MPGRRAVLRIGVGWFCFKVQQEIRGTLYPVGRGAWNGVGWTLSLYCSPVPPALSVAARPVP